VRSVQRSCHGSIDEPPIRTRSGASIGACGMRPQVSRCLAVYLSVGLTSASRYRRPPQSPQRDPPRGASGRSGRVPPVSGTNTILTMRPERRAHSPHLTVLVGIGGIVPYPNKWWLRCGRLPRSL
jgi:hypothetical protein